MSRATRATSGPPQVAAAYENGDDVVFPPSDLNQLLDLAHLFEEQRQSGFLLGPDGKRIPLPPEVHRVLRQVVEVMRQGRAILVAPQDLLLTTQEAADFLGISRPTLVKLLESGAIAFEKPNRHRRVRLQDLVDFQHKRRTDRRAVLDQLTEEASEMGLYDDTQSDYARALRKARQRKTRSTSMG